MAADKLRLQSFRTNDLVKDGGKQFELGKSWCDEFFEFDKTLPEVVVNLKFKAIQTGHVSLNDKIIELKLSDVSARGDRKAYTNGNNGMSQIKDFFINDLHLTPEKNLTDYFAIYKVSERDYYLYFVPSILYKNFLQFFKSVLPTVSINHDIEYLETEEKTSLQQIYYGAPGTGKSHTINKITEAQPKENVFRTTFHPDSDYSTFVGCYKPTMTERPIRNMAGEVVKEDDNAVMEKVITYSFCPQSFTKAYVRAWQTDEPVYLVIEEINRGNCAQIFGDLFQLLDRKDGFSEYPIKADNDLAQYLSEQFFNNSREDIPENVKSGEELVLPNNLYIWATMNTSDQSLFPIDSAFKRRWDWKYVPISNAGKNWRIEVNGKQYDWWDFLQKINEKIGEATNSEDKKLGYFFCKATNDIINAETFVGKVIFYIWNDVFKDFAEEAGNLFKDISFNKFYTVDEIGNAIVNEEKVALFLQNLGINALNNEEENDNVEDEASNGTKSNHKHLNSVVFPDGTKFSEENITHFDIYLESLKKIGLDTVCPLIAEMKYQRKGCPMVSTEKQSDILESNTYEYHQEGKYYIVKGAHDDTLINILEELKAQLNLDIEINFE